MERLEIELNELKALLEEKREQLELEDNNPFKTMHLNAHISSLVKRISNLQLVTGYYEVLDLKAE